MHDRRIAGTTYVFGNHGALWMNAMTWFDHETESIWTQPWGRALTGSLKGTQLQIIPFSLVPWGTWKAEHPETLALVLDDTRFYGQEVATNDFVAGVAIDDDAKAYPYRNISENIVTNDQIGEIPLVVHVNPETRSIHIFIRQLSDGTPLTFQGNATQLIDEQTGSVWNPEIGVAIEGELAGEGLRELPYISSFDWAWLDFYPHSLMYSP